MNALEAWREMNASFRIIIGAVLVIAGCALGRFLLLRDPGPPTTPSAEVRDVYRPAPEVKPIAPREVAEAPAQKRGYRGRLTITVQDTIPSAPGTAPVIVPRNIEVLIPAEDSAPVIRTEPGVAATARYQPIRGPWAAWAPGVLLGASVSSRGRTSPHGGVVVFRASRPRLDLGVGISREGAGPVVAWEVWREWAVVGQWNAVRLGARSSVASLGGAYRI